MELVALNCNNCGAKLKVGETAKFVTCKHCDTQLAIKHEGDASYTELVDAAARLEERSRELEGRAEELAERSEEIAGQHDVLVVQNDLDRLDREWEKEREGHLLQSKSGHKYEPTRAAATGLFMVAPVFLVIGALSYSRLSSTVMLIGGLAVTAIAALGASNMLAKARAFEAAKGRYNARREELEEQLAEARAAAPSPRKRSRRRRAADDAGAED